LTRQLQELDRLRERLGEATGVAGPWLGAAEADVSTATATNDLRRLSDAGWLTQEGRARSTRYHASATLREHIRDA
jgi:hypothetical protein